MERILPIREAIWLKIVVRQAKLFAQSLCYKSVIGVPKANICRKPARDYKYVKQGRQRTAGNAGI